MRWVVTEAGCGMQLGTKLGVLNVPQWYDAGKVWQDNHPEFPFSTLPTLSASLNMPLGVSKPPVLVCFTGGLTCYTVS